MKAGAATSRQSNLGWVGKGGGADQDPCLTSQRADYTLL